MNRDDVKQEIQKATIDRKINLPENSELKVETAKHGLLTSTYIISIKDGPPIAAVLTKNNGAPLVTTLPDTSIIFNDAKYKEYWASNPGERTKMLIGALKTETEQDKVTQWAKTHFEKYLNQNVELPSPLKAIDSPHHPNTIMLSAPLTKSTLTVEMVIGGAKMVGNEWVIAMSENCKNAIDNANFTKGIHQGLASTITVYNEIDESLKDKEKAVKQYITSADKQFIKDAFIQDMNNAANGKYSFFLSNTSFGKNENSLTYTSATTNNTTVTLGSVDKHGSFTLSEDGEKIMNAYIENITINALEDLKNQDIKLIENPIDNEYFDGVIQPNTPSLTNDEPDII